MKRVILSLCIVSLLSCVDDKPLTEINRHFTKDADLFNDIAFGDAKGDAFTLFTVKRSATSLEVKVGYSGGCTDHDFKLIWSGSQEEYRERPITSLALVHDGNGDMCEAFLTETIVFDLENLFDGEVTSGYDLLFYDGYSKDEYFMAEQTMNVVQGGECNLSVSFEEVICGDGFFDNRWFKSLDDNIIDGHDTFYFQPAEYDLDDNPQLGNYTVGVRILKRIGPVGDNAICTAYPGFSVPVKIVSLCAHD